MSLKKYQAGLLVAFTVLALAGAIGLNVHPVDIIRETHVATTVDGVPISFNVYYNRNVPDNRPLVVMGHGVIVNKEMMTNYAMELAARDFIVASIDWRGHGQSGGTLANANLNLDLEAVIAAMPAIVPSVDMTSIGLIGYSMGGRPTFTHAVNNTATVKAWIGVGTNVIATIANETTPNNVLLVYGEFDQAFSLDALVASMANLTGLASPADFQLGQLYGDVDTGTARQAIVVPLADHLTVPWDRRFIATVTGWVVRVFDGEVPDQAVMTWDARFWLLVAGLAGTVGLVYGLGLLLSSVLKLRKEEDENEKRVATRLDETGAGKFTGRYYAWTLLLVPSAIIPAVTFAMPLFLTAFLTTLVGWCAINVFIYTWRVVKRAGVPFPAFVRANLLPGAGTWGFSAIMTVAFVVPFYFIVGLNYLGMMPSPPRLPYLIVFGAISFTFFWMISTFMQKLVVPLVDARARHAGPRARLVISSLISSGLLFSWFFVIIMTASLLMGSFFLAMILTLMVPIFLLVGFVGTYFESVTGSPVPNAMLQALLLACVIVTLSPFGSILAMFGG